MATESKGAEVEDVPFRSRYSCRVVMSARDARSYVSGKVRVLAALLRDQSAGRGVQDVDVCFETERPGEIEELCPSGMRDCCGMLMQLRQSAASGQGQAEDTAWGSNAIMRCLADMVPAAQLYGAGGEGSFESAEVDQWMEFCWQEVEVVASVLVGAAAGDASIESAVLTSATEQLTKALAVLEAHLGTRTYLVGTRLSIADVALACALLGVFQHCKHLTRSLTALTRWFRTCASLPAFEQAGGEGGLAGALISSANIFEVSEGPEGSDGAADVEPLPVVPITREIDDALAPKWQRKHTRIRDLLAVGADAVDRIVVLKGWVRTVRLASKKSLAFVDLNDGSTLSKFQVVLARDACPGFSAVAECGGAGASLAVQGTVVGTPGREQPVELHATRVLYVGPVFAAAGDYQTIGGAEYPFAKKAHSVEHVRMHAHLRSRTRIYSSVVRVRHAMAYASHKFFNDRGFYYIHTPIITSADCEGAGEMFSVTTLLPEEARIADVPTTRAGAVDFSKDFFGAQAGLAVSGQLNVETHCMAMSDCYTFGPTFRAENSHTHRHLAEFWMIEPEIAFGDIGDLMNLAEDYAKFMVRYALEHHAEDLAFLEEMCEEGLRDRLANVAESDFVRIDYTQAIELLQQAIKERKVKFEENPVWGTDLGSEHERYITEKVYRKPVFVTNYPKGIKAFYMRMNDDGRTVAAMDLLVPQIGELMGGSQREERGDVLERRCREMSISTEALQWYLDLRRFGTAPHSGFGLGFERLVMFITGVSNIRDVIPFPRYPGHAAF